MVMTESTPKKRLLWDGSTGAMRMRGPPAMRGVHSPCGAVRSSLVMKTSTRVLLYVSDAYIFLQVDYKLDEHNNIVL